MGHIRLGLTYFETEEDFERIVRERERSGGAREPETVGGQE